MKKLNFRIFRGKRKKKLNLGMGLRLKLPGILIFAFYLLPFAFSNITFAQGADKTLDFDGINDYVSVLDAASLDITDAITIEAWFATTTIHQGWASIAEKKIAYMIQMYNNAPEANFALKDGTNWFDLRGTTPLNDGNWHHIAGTYNSGDAKLYVDGKLENSTTTAIVLQVTADPLIIGYGNVYFNGTIDEVRIWNVALSEATIQSWMCKKVTSSHPNWSNLKGYWRFDESSGTSCTDSSPNTNTGTMTNMDPATDRIWSGAALGDASAYDYTGTNPGDFSASISHTNGDDITATGDGGTFTGIQVYRVDETSMRTDATKPGAEWTMDPLRYWGVFAVGTSPTYTVTYDYDGHPGITNETDLDLAVRDDHNDNSWADLDATLDTDANTLTKTLQSGTEYTLGSPSGDNTLPIVLSDFTAQYLNEQAQLYWQTQSETDNLGWNVYRNTESDFTSANRINDEFILGHGTTAQPQDYLYEDTNGQFESGEEYWYWLESVDYSGKVHHYNKVAIMHISEGQDQEPQIALPLKYGLQYGPNPFNSNLTISYMLRKSDMVSVEIYNIYGQLLTEFDEGQRTADKMYKLKWNGKDIYGQDVASGVLLIKLITTEGSETKKVILLR